MAAAAPRTPTTSPGPINFDDLNRRYGLSREEVYLLALMEGLALMFNHQPRQVGPGQWEIDSRTEKGTVRHQHLEGNRILCDCPAARPEAPNLKPRFCSHTAAVHLWLCKQQDKQPLVRPMPPGVLRYDPSPEARQALAMIARPKAEKPQAEPKAQPAPAPELAEVLA
jgi:hypothetical protein